MLEIQVRKHCSKMFEGFERKIARNHKASQKKRNQNPAVQARFSKLCKARHLFLQHSPVTRRNLEWPPITASRHVGFAQLICFFDPFFHGFPRKSDGTEANFECLRRRCDKKKWAAFRAKVHALQQFQCSNGLQVSCRRSRMENNMFENLERKTARKHKAKKKK